MLLLIRIEVVIVGKNKGVETIHQPPKHLNARRRHSPNESKLIENPLIIMIVRVRLSVELQLSNN